MINPLLRINRLSKVLDELIELFHATPMAGAMQGVKANPALSMGANQGRGVYGWNSKERALRHLGEIATGDIDHFGSKAGVIPKKYVTPEGIDPGIMRLLVPKKSLRLDVSTLDQIKDPERLTNYISRNQNSLNEALSKRNIRIKGSGRKRLEDGSINPKDERIVEAKNYFSPPNKEKGYAAGDSLVVRRRNLLDEYKGHSSKSTRSVPVSNMDSGMDEELMGPIFDLLRNIDRKGYNELLEELLKKPNAAFRTLASPRGTRVT